MAAKHFVEDVGTILRFTIKDQDGVVVDISSATTLQVKIKTADGTQVTGTASFTTDGTDGKMEYATVGGDFGINGPAEAQPYVVITGFNGHGTKYRFNVDTSLA
jgi:hypothetical protein